MKKLFALVALFTLLLPLGASADYTYTYQNCGRGGCSSWLTSAAYPTRAACDTARSERPVSGPPHGACNGTDTAGSGGTGTQYCFTAQTRGTSNAQRECFATNQACGTGRTAAEARGDAVTVCAPVSNAAGGVTGNIAVSDGAPINYGLLAPLPGIDDTALVPYLMSALQLLIGIAGLIGVIRLVICGFELLTAPGESKRSHAKECLWKIVLGLLLAISSFILLQTISPALVTPTFEPPSTASAEAVAGGQSRPTAPGYYYSYRAARTGRIVFSRAYPNTTECGAAEQSSRSPEGGGVGVEIIETCFEVRAPAQGGNNYCVGGQPSATYSQPNEESARQQLCGNTSCVGTSPVGINANACADTCARGCTNVQGLPGGAITQIRQLAQSCNCTVTVTGGTEYHLHVSHAANRAIFDLRKTAALDAIIRQGTESASFSGYRKYLVNGFFYTNEGDHWHVCQSGVNTSRGCNP